MLYHFIYRLLFRNRLLCHYWDGCYWRSVNPITLDRKLEAIRPRWRELIAYLKLPEVPEGIPEHLLHQANQQRDRAIKVLVEAARSAFSLSKSLPPSACLEVLAQLLELRQQLLDEAAPIIEIAGACGALPHGLTQRQWSGLWFARERIAAMQTSLIEKAIKRAWRGTAHGN